MRMIETNNAMAKTCGMNRSSDKCMHNFSQNLKGIGHLEDTCKSEMLTLKWFIKKD
jgi:hypothetical protein